MPKVMCPICKEVFTSRSKLTEHKAKTGHTGGAVIYVEPPKADKKKTNKAKSSKKPHSCPRCDRSFKNKKALENHQRDKKHFDVGKIVKKKKTIQKTLPKVSVKEVITTTPIVGDGYVVIRNKDYEKIMEDLEVLKNFVKLENISFEMLPQTSSWLVSYQLANESDWDYILFYCDFVEIEHTLESFIALENKLNLNNKPIVFDLASLDEREGISKDIYISQECLMITQKEDEKVSYGDMLVSLQQKISSENNSLTSSDLLLVGGSWNKPKPLAPKYDSTITTKWTKQQGAYGSRYYEDDYYGMSIYGAEENIKDSSLEADEGVVEDKIEIFNTNPVYLITNERLCIDKLVNVELVVIPKENPSEDDVKKKVNIEDDVKKKVNIEDDVQDTSGGVEMKEKITTYSDFNWSIRGGKPLGDNLNRLIDIIEKTPMEKFDNASSNKNLGEISEGDIVSYLFENPQSLFLSKNFEVSQSGDDGYSIFTNFDLKIPSRILQYDIIRISADGAADLTEVKEVVRHGGMRVGKFEENYWTHIDFLTTSEEDDVQEEVNIEDDVQDTSGGVEMKEKITTYSNGEPLSANLNRIIDAIERTPMDKFGSAATFFDNTNSDIYLGDWVEDKIVEYLYKNPQSLFLYNNPKSEDDDYSIFTNFVVKKLGKIIKYDIIRISADGAADLTEVKEVVRHDGIGVESLDENYWTYMGQFPLPYWDIEDLSNIEYSIRNIEY